jgi:tetratricopeptide (TPR) repeat protein
LCVLQVKALLRRATARDALQKYELAEKDLKAVLNLEPNNKQAREDLQALRQHKAQMAEAQTSMAAQMRQQLAGVPGGLSIARPARSCTSRMLALSDQSARHSVCTA